MGRWQPDAQARLQEAALALYAERGYDETTVAEIAERAGLTKRTFFRYFADKREVLFFGSERLQQQMVAAMAGDFEKFYKEGNKAAGTRVRLAMQELKTFAQTVRTEVQSIKNSEKA